MTTFRERVTDALALIVVVLAWPLIRAAEWVDERREAKHEPPNVVRMPLEYWRGAGGRQRDGEEARIIRPDWKENAK